MIDSDTPPPDPYARLERAVRRLIDGGGDADYYRLEAAYWHLQAERAEQAISDLQAELVSAVSITSVLSEEAGRSTREAALYRTELAAARRELMDTRQGWAADIAGGNGRER